MATKDLDRMIHLQKAVTLLEDDLAEMRAEEDRDQLSDLDPDTAFEHGFAAAIFTLKHAV